MNCIGIDHEHTLTILGLREGFRIRSVGDGIREQIPNVVSDDDPMRWGSHAWQANNLAELCYINQRDGAIWIRDLDASRFWRGIYDRVYSFLGRLEPTHKNGYHVAVGIQAAQSSLIKRLLAIGKNVGFDDFSCILSTDAILCRWLIEQPIPNRSKCIITSIAIGDDSVTVRSYQVIGDIGKLARIQKVGQPILIPDTGHARWVEKVLSLASDRFGSPISNLDLLKARDEATELGIRLCRMQADEFVAFGSLYGNPKIPPLNLNRSAVKMWPEAARLSYYLPIAVQQSTSDMAVGGKPDLIICGGPGAMWPFIDDILKDHLSHQIWQSSSPQQDISWGAAWWTEIGERNQKMLHHVDPFCLDISQSEGPQLQSRQTCVADAEDVLENKSEISSKAIPPWKRQSRLRS